MSDRERAREVVRGLGGAGNIRSIAVDHTRLHLRLRDVSRIDDDSLRRGRVSGLVYPSGRVQLVPGTLPQPLLADVLDVLRGREAADGPVVTDG